jgi:preprotein translocase subunit SecA
MERFQNDYEHKESQVGSELLRKVEKNIMLQSLDSHWKEHLAAMDHLRESIHLRGYAQKDPTQEYKRESFNMFWEMLDNIKYDTIRQLTLLELQAPEEAESLEQPLRHPSQQPLEYHHDDISVMSESEGDQQTALAAKPETYVREHPKIGRNDPCHCGSNKKYKHCHGRAQ